MNFETLQEAYVNAKAIEQANKILLTQDEIFRKLKKNKGTSSQKVFEDINEVMALEKLSDYDNYNDMMPSEQPLGEI